MVYLLGLNPAGADYDPAHVSGTLKDASVIQTSCTPIVGGPTYSVASIADVVSLIRMGFAYAEFHSIVYPFAVRPGYPPGEIRGQIN